MSSSAENTIRIAIDEFFHDSRLDSALFKLVEQIPSRAFATKLIKSNYVTVNGENVKASLKLRKDDCVVVDLSALSEKSEIPEPEKMNLDVLFEDDNLIVINKPAGLVVHPGAGVHSGTLVNAILAHCGITLPTLGTPARAGIVHRLDRDTSGVMVVAKTQLALTELSKQFSDHSQTREYVCLAFNTPQSPKGRIETFHGRDPRNRVRYAVVSEGEGKKAILDYEVIQLFKNGLCCEVLCRLFTGRTHQIRVQMTHIKCPLMGDDVYMLPSLKLFHAEKELGATLKKLLTRQMLHARKLGFIHPISKKYVEFICEPPQDYLAIRQLLQQ